MIRVILPAHLQLLARTSREVQLTLTGPPTLGALVDALELQFPMLRGTIRDIHTHQRRDFVRFFACGLDYSHQPPDEFLPAEVIRGEEPLRIVGAMAGG